MTCYKLTIQNHIIKNSNTLLITELKEIFGTALNRQIGFMYKNNSDFPKEYYFISTEEWITEKLKEKFNVVKTEQPSNFVDNNFQYLGNKDLFELKL